MEQVREALRLRHYRLRTEQAYAHWVKRFVLFHGKRHPREMGAAEVASFLSWLAVEGQVSAATQGQALAALLFFTNRPLAWICPGWMKSYAPSGYSVCRMRGSPTVMPTTIALVMSPLSVYCTFIQFPQRRHHMVPHHSASQFRLKTAGILVFGTLIGLWLGHQDKGYQPGPTSSMESVVLQQTQQTATFQRTAQDQPATEPFTVRP
ncbi:MAG: phage integrase N-terminal SAM-like domain-containing protein [Acidithiobacillus sp.]